LEYLKLCKSAKIHEFKIKHLLNNQVLQILLVLW